MLLIDLMQIIIPNIAVAGSKSGGDISPSLPLIRHMVFKSLAGHKKRFSPDYTDDIVICIDDNEYWRREVFPPYKYSRKKSREDSALDWTKVFEFVNIIKEELRSVLPYKILQVPRAEADDIIAVLCQHFGDYKLKTPKIMIVSGDKDLTQLLKFANVEQYDVLIKKDLITCNNPEAFLREHIIRGDVGDGIPNICTVDEVFMGEKMRQTPIMQAKLNQWIVQEPDEFCTTDRMKAGFARNQLLIDLSKIPEDVRLQVIESYNSATTQDKKKLKNYFIKNKMSEMAREINYF